MGVIYKITSPSGKIYVGQTVNINRRKSLYRNLHCGKQIKLYASLKKYGFDAHAFEILEDGIPEEMLSEREIYWIQECKSFYKVSPNGMNMNVGGCKIWDNKHREEFADKFRGKKNPFYGKQHSEETKQLLSHKNREYNIVTGKKPTREATLKGAKKTMKAVVLYDKKGTLIKSYGSLIGCAKNIGVPMGCVKDAVLYGSCIRGSYFVKYDNGSNPTKIEVGKIKKAGKRPLLCFLNSYMIEYPSAVEASNDLQIPKPTIAHAALHYKLKPLKSGYIFIYKDLYDEILKAAS